MRKKASVTGLEPHLAVDEATGLTTVGETGHLKIKVLLE